MWSRYFLLYRFFFFAMFLSWSARYCGIINKTHRVCSVYAHFSIHYFISKPQYKWCVWTDCLLTLHLCILLWNSCFVRVQAFGSSTVKLKCTDHFMGLSFIDSYYVNEVWKMHMWCAEQTCKASVVDRSITLTEAKKKCKKLFVICGQILKPQSKLW